MRSTSAQTINNFTIVDSKVEWQNIYNTSMDSNNLYKSLVLSGIFKEITKTDGILFGEMKPMDADYLGAGYSSMLSPIYISGSLITAFAIIELKEGKYRVTLKNIQFFQKQSDALTEKGAQHSLEDFALKSNQQEFKRLFGKSASEILNYTFTQKFSLSPLRSSDW
jgi:hypothetical protein